MVRALLSDLVERGLDAERPRLWVIEGGKALRRAIVECFGATALIRSGRQWMSWIHLNDHIAIQKLLLEDVRLHGAFNLTAPKPITNGEFTETLARCLGLPACRYRLPS